MIVKYYNSKNKLCKEKHNPDGSHLNSKNKSKCFSVKLHSNKTKSLLHQLNHKMTGGNRDPQDNGFFGEATGPCGWGGVSGKCFGGEPLFETRLYPTGIIF
jgi:hypothetical protein